MHRRQRTAASRVQLGALVAGLVLSLMGYGMQPAQAAADQTAQRAPVTQSGFRPAASSRIVYRTTAPRWVGGAGTTRARTPGTNSYNVDWQWLKGGWEVKFNWSETKQIGRGLSYCTAVAALLPTGISQAVAASCGVLWVLADIAVSKGKCVKIFVPISLINTSIGTWSCSH